MVSHYSPALAEFPDPRPFYIEERGVRESEGQGFA